MANARKAVIALVIAIPLVWLAFWGRSHYRSFEDLPEEIRFNRDIRPILSNKCFACHGPDKGTRQAGLRLDIREVALARREGYDRPAIVPGSPDKSALILRVRHEDPEKRMPPPQMNQEGSGGDPLTDREIALLQKWIEEGAEWENHWAYTELRHPQVPQTESGAAQGPIDQFIVSRLEKLSLQPSPEADRHTLIRRLSLDLLGLPPTPADVEAFVQDTSSDAYEKRVDRFLASPHFGERMAIFWLDLVRFADTDGYHSDLHRRLWPYRDYVIQAFNENKPFDQFTREQVAGDLLPDATREQIVAAAFNRLGQATKEGGSQPKEYLPKYAADRVRTISTAWMGSTMDCAECHDHKFDPFTQQDFYSMAAFFADVKERGLFKNENSIPPEMLLLGEGPEAVARLRQLRSLEKKLDEIQKKTTSGGNTGEIKKFRTEIDPILDAIPRAPVTRSVEPRMVRILPRGNWQDDSGEVVEPDVPEFLPDLNVNGRRADRLDLADWLVSSDNPLTARVFVNRLWKRFFGTGLSRTLNDVGSQAEWPTHPELLDWLAVEFMESGWNVKYMVKLMIMSVAYRQASKPTEKMRQIDPENRYLARQSRFRVEAEIVRDNALAISGLLNAKVGGPSFKPYQPEDYWRDIETFGTEGPATTWEASKGEDQYRRGLYTYWKRSFLHPSLQAFDAPSRQECTANRALSNTPLQALVLLNDPSYVEAARVFAYRLLEQSESGFEDRLQWAFQQALGRAARAEEIIEMEKLFRSQSARYSEDREAARKLISVGQQPVPEDVSASVLAAWTSVTRAILNLHETITRY